MVSGIGIKKVVKRNAAQETVFSTPPELVGGIFLYGKIGSGKSTGMTSMAQKYHDHPDRRFKIIHLWGGDRSEQLYWSLPSRDYKYWEKVKKSLKLRQEGPKQYKVTILYPATKDTRKKLPQFPPYVKSKIFTIPINSVEVEDISLCIGTLPPTAETTWREAKDKLRKKDNGAYLIKALKDMGAQNSSLYKSFVHPLMHHRLLTEQTNGHNLDLVSELKDRDTITVLCLDFIEKEFKLFVLGWFLRQMAYMIDNGKVPTKNIVMIQEAAEFFRATDDSIVPERYKIFRKHLANYVRYGRRGMHMFMDAQSPSETKGMVDGSQDLTVFGRLVSEADKEAGTKQLYRDNLITKKQIQEMSLLNPGEYFIQESGKKSRKRYFFLPRTMYWKKGYGNFYDNVWKNLVDQWVDVRPILDELEEGYQNGKKMIEEDEEKRREAERVKKELKEKAEEQKKIEAIRKRAQIEEEMKEERRQAKQEARKKLRADRKGSEEESDEVLEDGSAAEFANLDQQFKKATGSSPLEQAKKEKKEKPKEESIKTSIDSNINDKKPIQKEEDIDDDIDFD